MWTYSIPPLQSLLQQAKEQADEFHQSYQSLDAGLGSVEEAQGKEEPIHSEVEVVKQQLEAHKVRVTASSSIFFSAQVPYPFCPSSMPISISLSIPVSHPFLFPGSNHYTNRHRNALD